MKTSRRDLLRWAAAGAATAFAPLAYADYSSGNLEVVHKTIRLPRWKANGLKLAFLTDFHVVDEHRTEIAEEAIRLALDSKPDVILLGGDLVDESDPRRLRNLARMLAGFDSTHVPVATVLGNHDYWADDVHRIMDVIRSSKVRLLRNEAIEFDGVVVGGVDDGIALKQDPKLLDRYASHDSVIALYHEPDFVVELPSSVSFMLAGHSHGGQICLPGGISVHTPRGAKRYIAGLYPEAHVPLYVSRGVGTTGPDYRLFCRPEVTILTLQGS